ncbi:uncharacterized protein [Primulina eburnea]|uniref:uncharacterized protein isoform X2 n=1 Tax=Primulina eburnea TaxID=1245227 RepID=UPI003C6C32CB
MHVEKNVCENIIGTLLNQKKKSKDGVNARRDLMHLKIREELHPQEKGENKYHLPAAPYTLSKKEMNIFCSRLKKIKLPDGYSSNIGNCVSLEERKLIGLKSHDCHVLMQQLLSVALRNLLPKGPRNAIYLLGAFYNELCQRVLDRNRLEQLEENIAEILCMLERYFPPAFFTISVHLTIHLAREARLCGPVQFRWMYPFERFMKTLKGFVKNRARPEGCIAECYLAEERMIFCSAYIKNISITGVRYNRNDDLENGLVEGRSISKGKEKILEDHVLQAAHRYVLFNTAEVEPYLQMHIEELKQIDRCFVSNETLLQKKHMETFAEWLSKQEHVASRLSGMNSNNSANSSQDLHDQEPTDDNKPDKKKGRGTSKLKMISGQDKRKEVERNELGQPIGDNSITYASFLGCMIKEFVPYTLDGWNDIDEEVKDRMWSCLQMNYKVEDWEKKSVFQKLAKLWRDRKSKLQILVREANTSRVASRNLSLLKPEFMDQNQWDLFVKRTLSPTFQEKSAKFRTMREKKDHIHTMSRRGYARLTHIMENTTQGDAKITRSQVWIEGHKKKNGEPITEAVGEKMKKIQECPPESQNTTNIADDAISLVFGKETRGRVRGMGFGVTPSKVGAYVQQNGTVKQLQNMVHNLQQEMQEMKSMFLQSMRQQNQQEQVASGGIGSGIGNEVGSNSDINIGAKKICNVKKHLATAQSNLKNVSCGDICPNSKCKLLDLSVDGLVVAEGRIASTDPNTKVHHVVLGRSCWKVWIDKVLVEKVDLIRPNDEMQFLDDAIGSTVAWLSKFVVLCD